MNYIKFALKNICNFITPQMAAPAVIQPLIMLLIFYLIPNNMFLISIILAFSLGISIFLTKSNSKSSFLHYWTILSISYIIIAFEWFIVPLAEILYNENFFLVLFTLMSLMFLYLTIINAKKFMNDGIVENVTRTSLSGENVSSVCPVCRVLGESDYHHCSICQECIPKYNYHCYWLNCCISDYNIHLYFVGILFGVLALAYGSLLILTSICSPDFHFGILLPEDCTDVCFNIETCACLVCGIYSMELSVILAFNFLYVFWLISTGRLATEGKGQMKHHAGKVNLYGAKFLNNWICFFKKFRRIHIEL